MSDTLQKKDEATSLARPAFVPTGAAGTEHLTREDIKLPRLTLSQALSPQVQEGEPEQIPGLKIGEYFNDLTGEVYGRGPLHFAIVRADPPHYIEFRPRNEGGGVVDMNVPAGDPRTQFTKNEKGESVKPVATKFYDYIIMLLKAPENGAPAEAALPYEMLTFSLASSGLKMAMILNSMIAGRNAPIYYGRYRLETKLSKGKEGPYWSHIIKNAGWLNEATALVGEKAYHNLKDRKLTIEREPGEDDFPTDE